MRVIAIAAVSDNGVIGQKGEIPWQQKWDKQHFQHTTLGFPVIMGRSTYQSIGKKLPKRENIVVSSTIDRIPDCYVVRTPLDALKYCLERGIRRCFVIGGQRIYEAGMPYFDEILITRIHCNVEGDRFFPPIPDSFSKYDCFYRDADAENQYPTNLERWLPS